MSKPWRLYRQGREQRQQCVSMIISKIPSEASCVRLVQRARARLHHLSHRNFRTEHQSKLPAESSKRYCAPDSVVHSCACKASKFLRGCPCKLLRRLRASLLQLRRLLMVVLALPWAGHMLIHLRATAYCACCYC